MADAPISLHRNTFILCVGSSVALAGSFFVYSELIRQLESSPCENPKIYEDAKTWLQVLLIALCIFVSGAAYSFFSIWRC